MSVNPKQVTRALKLFRALAKAYFADHPNVEEEDEDSNAEIPAATVTKKKPVEEVAATSSPKKAKKKAPVKKRERDDDDDTPAAPPATTDNDTTKKKAKKEQGPFTCPGRLWEDGKPSCPGGEGSDVLDRSRFDGHIRDTCKICKKAFQKFKNAEKKRKKKEEEEAAADSE